MKVSCQGSLTNRFRKPTLVSTATTGEGGGFCSPSLAEATAVEETEMLAETVTALEAARKRHARIKSRSERLLAIASDRIDRLSRELQISKAGLDLDKVKLAETVVQVTGDASRVVTAAHSCQASHNVRSGAISTAINDIASNSTGRLRREYMGVKNYDHFGDQRSDCSYGMGPRHGSIVFRVGLTEEARKRGLTEEETEAALYYLLNIIEIQSAAKADA